MKTCFIDFKVPAGWAELDDRYLRYVYGLIAAGHTSDSLKLRCLLRWNDTHIIGRQPSGAYLLERDKILFETTALMLAEVISRLRWLDSVPCIPVRLAKMGRCRAVAADFQGVPMETFIICDNLYQGFLQTGNDSLLDQLAEVLYPGLKRKPLKGAERFSLFYWMVSLKEFFSRRWPDFFQPAGADNANLLGGTPNYGAMLQEVMDAQIRALTKGDITKESEILALDTWRALTELNAQAKEYRQLKQSMKK